MPPALFASRAFTVANVYTLVVYAALGAVFFFLALDLQVVAGYDPLHAGISMLPLTAIMLALSAHSGALAQRIGPKLQLTVGPLVAACGLALTLRIAPDASYLGVVLPAIATFGLGLAALVAPLTATVLTAAPVEHAGVASAVNNAVARAAGLLAVALLPSVVGLSGHDYRNPEAFAAGYRLATLIEVALLAVGSLLAAIGVPAAAGEVAPGTCERRHCFSCPVDGPRLESIQPAGQRTGP